MKYRLPEPFLLDEGPIGVVLLHAYSGSANDMRMLARHLQRENISSIGPNFAGHGSFEPLDIFEKGQVSLWWQDTVSAIEKMQNKKPVFVFGLSLGGLFALKALYDMPNLAGGGFFGTPILNSVSANLKAPFNDYAKTLYQKTGLSQTLMTTKMQAINQQLPKQLAEIDQFRQTVKQLIPNIKQPLFIGQGQKDLITDVTQTTQLVETLKQQSIDYHIYPESGHVITVGNARKQLGEDVVNFIQKQI